MIKQFHYDSDMAGGSLMVRESRIVAGLLMDGVTPEQWDEAIRVENVLQKRTPASAKRNATAIRKRLERLEPEFWRALRDGDAELVVSCQYNEDKITVEGASIDDKESQKKIVNIMEGGREAFERRKIIYQQWEH